MSSSIIVDLIINIAASVIFFIVGYISSKMLNITTSIILTRFWKKFLSSPSIIIVPTLPKEYKENITNPNINDLKIGSIIDDILSKINKDILIQEEQFSQDKIMTHNIILVGSPKTNRLTKEIFDDFTIPIDFKDDKIIFKNKEYPSRINEIGEIVEDYGIIIYDNNYYNDMRQMVIIAGNTAIGTYNAAKVISKTKYLRKIVKSKFENDYIVLVKTTVDDYMINDPEIIKQIVEKKQRIILDVRPREFYEDGHLPGALSFPLADFETVIAGLLEITTQQSPILVYCSGFECTDSHQFAANLNNIKFTDVKVYSGGFTQWLEMGYEIEKNEK
ncbi:MAG: rhodanese-like domain-containing protein [Candidatus Thorarchaeota archaeon]